MMNEFLDIYRLYAKNFDNDWVEKPWSEEDIEKLKRLLDKICGEIQNGHIIVKILKNDLDIWQDLEMIYALQNVRDAVFEMELLLHPKDRKKKPDQVIEENVEERKKKEKKLELERDEIGKWKKILEGEKPLKRYGTIGIYPTIKDYIWDRLPTDFEQADVIAFFKEFYEEKLDRRLKESSYGTYANRYIKYFKERDPPIMSWEEYNYSKNVSKYKTVDKEPEKKEEKIDIPLKQEDTKQKKAEEIIEDELTKDIIGGGGLLTEGTKKLLREEPEKEEKAIEPEPLKEHIDEKEKEIIEPYLVKTKISNPFHAGSVEHHLYQTAVEANWPSFKKGTPLITIMTRMSNFSKDEIKKAIDILVREKKAKRLPNSIAFSE